MIPLSNRLNVGQEIFLVVFSILYGVLLQSLPGGLFPLASSFRGKTYRWGGVSTRHQKIWFRRSLLSIFIFNLMPAVYLFKILFVLQTVSFPTSFLQQLVYILVVFWFSLGVFGFYRIYYIIVILCRSLFIDMEVEFNKRGLSYDVWSHLYWVLFYLLPGFACFIRALMITC